MAHGLEHAVHVLLAVDGDDDDGTRRLGHDQPGRLHTIHHRHDEVHENQVGRCLGTLAHGLGTIAGHPDHLMRRLQGQGPAQRFYRHGHIVDDGDLHP
ncbi:hypothetical protein D3C81_1817990 [compost metagenome]